jgi:hypothetical protein
MEGMSAKALRAVAAWKTWPLFAKRVSGEPWAGDLDLSDQAVRMLMATSADGCAAIGPVIGIFRDRPIYEWIEDGAGRRFDFQAVAPEPWQPRAPDIDAQLQQDATSWVVAPGVVYRLMAPQDLRQGA